MIVADQIRKKIDSFPAGYVFSLGDFSFEGNEEVALAKMLSRMAAKGELRKASRGRYYKPRKTIFGVLGPADEQLVRDLLVKEGKLVGYVTGTRAFAEMGFTTQISSALVIGANKYRRPLMRGGYRVTFMTQENVITEENVELLRMLDAVRLIREIPAATPDETCKMFIGLVRMLPEERRVEVRELALKYSSYVRAVVGAVLELTGTDASPLRRSLNWTSSYDLRLSEKVLPNKKEWRIK